jgi:hypothetical protein
MIREIPVDCDSRPGFVVSDVCSEPIEADEPLLGAGSPVVRAVAVRRGAG